MSWTFAPVFDAGHRATVETGKNLVYVAPPTAWGIRPLLAQLPSRPTEGLGTLVLTPESTAAAAVARIAAACDALAPAAPLSEALRGARLLATKHLRALVASPPTVLELVRRARLDLHAVPRLVVLWPELHGALGQEGALDTLLAEARGAQRLIATADPGEVQPFLERHAHRAPVLAAARLPEAPTGAVRFATVEEGRVEAAVRAVLERLDPERAFVWDPSDRVAELAAAFGFDPTVWVGADPGEASVTVAVATDLPSTDALEALRTVAGEVVILVRPWQVTYLHRLAARCTSLRLPSAADGAEDRRRHWREAIRARLAAETPTGDLLALAPLFEEFDPALVAAALLSGTTPPPGGADNGEAAFATWAHLRLSVGGRDRVRTGDVVGAMLNAVGLAKHQLGRVDVRDTYTLVEVRADVAEQARRGLNGTVLKGRSVTAQFDRR